MIFVKHTFYTEKNIKILENNVFSHTIKSIKSWTYYWPMCIL